MAEPADRFTDEQRAVFRSAAAWMAAFGGIELAAGGLLGLLWLLFAVGVVPPPEPQSAADRVTLPLGAVASAAVGLITLTTARAFRRAARAAEPGYAAVTAAVTDLRELYERQVILAATLLAIGVGTALLWP